MTREQNVPEAPPPSQLLASFLGGRTIWKGTLLQKVWRDEWQDADNDHDNLLSPGAAVTGATIGRKT